MNEIKREIHIGKQMCYGCLSVDRKLERLQQNTDLFFMLLNNSVFLSDDLRFINILLCWECIALLRRIKSFQNQIQKAKQYLTSHRISNENSEPNMKTLSSLKIVKKYNIDITYNADDVEVKLEWVLPKTEEKFPDLKEETFDDINDIELPNDTDLYNNIDDTYTDTEGILYDTKNIPKIKNSKRKNVKKLKPNTLKLDMNKTDLYVRKVSYTINDLEILSKDKFNVFKSVSRRITDHFKKLIDMKSKDTKKISKSEGPYTCSCCNAEFTPETINNHWEEHSVVAFKCELCNRHFMHYSDLPGHMRRSHSKVYTCRECGIRFSLLREYNNHYRDLHKTLVCDHCGKHFGNKRSIEKHMRCNHLPAKCEACDQTFEKYEKLRKHKRHHHMRPASGASRELCYCVECNKQYPHMDAYKHHLRSAAAHTPRKTVRIPCPECGRVFTRSTYMNNHYRLVHVKQSKHYCQLCDKYFINGYALRTHCKYVHEKAEKPRLKICDICGKGFNATRTLVNHRRTHTGERPYRCPHCPAAFTQLSAQKTHARTQHKYLK